jgi:hypothetical protein
MSATLTTNILNPAATSGGVNSGTNALYVVLRHIRIVNKTATPATFSLWIGVTNGNVAGTEVIGQGLSVPANNFIDWYGYLLLVSTDFLVGGAGTAAALTIEGEGEIGVRI